MSLPSNIRIICQFDANSPEVRPTREFLKDNIEKNWDFISELKKSDYVQELMEARENL